MPMTIRGQFQQTPFPALCLEIWRSRLTGVLKIQLPDYPSEIIFQEGDLALTLEVIDRTRFLEFLATQVKSIEKKFITKVRNGKYIVSPKLLRHGCKTRGAMIMRLWDELNPEDEKPRAIGKLRKPTKEEKIGYEVADECF